MIKNVSMITALAVYLLVSACATITPEKAGPAKTDLFELERTAAAAYSEGDLAASERYYSQLTGLVPEEAVPWFRLGNVYARTNRPAAAIAAYQEALVRDPAHAKAWYNMGVVQLKMAAHSFNQMQIHVAPADSLYDSGDRLFEGILELLQDSNPE